jgi:hypothetical protein
MRPNAELPRAARQLFKLLASTRVRVVSKLAFRRIVNMTAKDYPRR